MYILYLSFFFEYVTNTKETQTSLKGLPHEIAVKLKISSETWSERTHALAQRAEELEGKYIYTYSLLTLRQHWITEYYILKLCKIFVEYIAQTKEILENKQEGDVKAAEQIATLEKTIEQLRVELSDQTNNERITQLEQENTRLEEQIKKRVRRDSLARLCLCLCL